MGEVTVVEGQEGSGGIGAGPGEDFKEVTVGGDPHGDEG